VVAAYDQLLAQGLVEARKNRGFFVREAAPAGAEDAPAPPAMASAWTRATGSRAARPAPVNATALIRGMFHKISNKPQPAWACSRRTGWRSTFMPAAVRKVTSTRRCTSSRCSTASRMGDAACAGRCPQAGGADVPPRRSRSSPPSARRTRWTSSVARCCAQATR
jgi:hypothetical protein